MKSHQQETEEVTIHADDVQLPGLLTRPPDCDSLVIFVHGSGSSRLSPRNRYVADVLNDSGIATLLFDLLTPEEEQIDNQTRELRFDIELLGRRTVAALDWISGQASLKHLKPGLFGASTGAAAALIAAAARPAQVAAVVSRGGRPDLALQVLKSVRAATLLIVGEYDQQVLELNRQAAASMNTTCETRVVSGATHLFEEPGTLEQAALLACEWFQQYLGQPEVGDKSSHGP